MLTDQVKLNTFTGLHSFELLDGIVTCVSDLKIKNVSKRKEMDLKNLIVYVSSSYGGRSSDKFIVINSGILDKLDPYDAVMVDRGFLIFDSGILDS
ncbi:hypothetical protein ALC57_12575 [Trachymyrmex cornetzi]|uniref:DDE Tnp4 domain-containing protein n=1 Tax=Trachymyrmex cornetzi TaxID=471704 RepID=A0A151K3C2_9HYME|nr:hypothetical protein ALC57_12575 [Trachymyrmex cornetzi]